MTSPAVKTAIHEVFVGFHEDENGQKLIIDGHETAIVRVTGRVVAIFLNEDETFGSITLDDETSTIRAKFFSSNIGEMKSIKMGDLVEVMGRVKKYQDEVHLICDSFAVFEDVNYEFLRKLELVNRDEGFEKKVFFAIKGGESKRDDLIEKFGLKAIKTIAVLMDKGDIYEGTPGIYSAID